MEKKFMLADFSKQALNLFDESRAALSSCREQSLRDLSVQVPKNFQNDKDPLSIVFAGQYSAGKSSILKLLTDKDIVTGQGVTTDAVSRYEWNGLTVLDTPGIHTQRHPDHDAITYDAISKADLIVFVLTNEGFGAHLGSHFRKLVYEMNKGREMMLVMNKMDNDALGNDPSVHAIKKRDIDKVLAPSYDADDMFMSFISADSWQEFQKAVDSEERDYYRQQSGWDDFIDNLNKFSAKKGLLGKCTTSLFQLEKILEQALASFNSDSKEADISREIMQRNRRALKECKDSILRKARVAIEKNASKIMDLGNALALNLDSSSKEASYEKEVQKSVDQTSAIAGAASDELDGIINEEAEKLEKAFQQIASSPLAQTLFSHLKNIFSDLKVNDGTMQNMQKCALITKNFGIWLQKLSIGPKANGFLGKIFTLRQYSDSRVHNTVKELGKFMGYKFKPFEALKITGKISQAGKFLGVAGAIAGVAFQIWNDSRESDAEKSLMEARSSIRENFRNASNSMEMEYNEQTKSWISKELDPKLQDLDKSIDELDQIRQIEDREYKKISMLLERTRSLINEIQNSF